MPNPFVPDFGPLQHGLTAGVNAYEQARIAAHQRRLDDLAEQRQALAEKRQAEAHAQKMDEAQATILGEAEQLLAAGAGAETATAHYNARAKRMGWDPIKVRAVDDPIRSGTGPGTFGYEIDLGNGSTKYVNPEADKRIRAKATAGVVAAMRGEPMFPGALGALPGDSWGPPQAQAGGAPPSPQDARLGALMGRAVAGERGEWNPAAIANPGPPNGGVRPWSGPRSWSPEGAERRWDRRTTGDEPTDLSFLPDMSGPTRGEPLIGRDELRKASDEAHFAGRDEADSMAPYTAAIYRAAREGVLTPQQLVQFSLLDESRDAVRLGMQARVDAAKAKGARRGGTGAGPSLKDKDALAALARTQGQVKGLVALALSKGAQHAEGERQARDPMGQPLVGKDGKPVMEKYSYLKATDPRSQAELDGIQAQIDQAMADREATLSVSSERIKKAAKTVPLPRIGRAPAASEGKDDDSVAVVDPEGKLPPKRIPRTRLAEAEKAGWKVAP